jgi:hypothetical protein
VDPAQDRDLICPRCRYNLRGLTLPRCPECGLTFDDEQWRSGVLREHIPTWLDQCDPWQPHQVLVRSVYEVVHGALRPRWLLTKLDLNGPLLPAGLMLVFGTLWVYVLFTALVTVATILHTDASPYAALKSAALWWSPRVLANSVLVGVLTALWVVSPTNADMLKLTRRAAARLVAHWLPVAMAFVALPLGVALAVVPGLATAEGSVWPPLALGLITARVLGVRKRANIRAIPAVAIVGLMCLFLVSRLQSGSGWALPHTLDPPWWVYF